MSSNPKKILVALDGSGHSFDAVRYLCRVLPTDGTTITLFSVYSRRPERLWDTEEAPFSPPDMIVGDSWETRQKAATGTFLENVRRTLLHRGFPPDAVIIKIQEKKIGIARDILLEAKSGYDAVVFGRQGMNPITRLVIGSVASKLIEGLTDVPLWLVGSDTENAGRMLIAMDGSENALRAVTYIGDMAAGADIAVTLFQVIRSFDFKLPGSDDPLFMPDGNAGRPDESREARTVRKTFETAVGLLESAGIHPRRITTKTISGVATRSGTIIAQAAAGGYGTIVIGRRGHSRVGEFHMGRVTNKVIQLAGRTAVWVVS